MLNRLRSAQLFVWFGLFIVAYFPVSSVEAASNFSQGQLLYVPVYSHIFFGDRQQSFNLSVTLSLRNTDLTNPIEITSVRYYDEKGKLVKDYAPPAISIDPLAATRFYVKESDVSAGSEACFLVRWQSPKKVSPPVIEALMVGTSFGQGISFTAPGRVLQELPGK
jgi:hypothetical protein